MEAVSASLQPDSCPICAKPTTSLSLPLLSGFAASAAGAVVAAAAVSAAGAAVVAAVVAAVSCFAPHPAIIDAAIAAHKTRLHVFFLITISSFIFPGFLSLCYVSIVVKLRKKVFTIKREEHTKN